MSLIICDPKSIEERDKGRLEFEELERARVLKELKGKVECPKCQYDDPKCTGPNVVDVFEESSGMEGYVVWECSTPDCPCCGEYHGENEFKTNMEGNVLS